MPTTATDGRASHRRGSCRRAIRWSFIAGGALVSIPLAAEGPVITQFPGTAGCISETGTSGQCTDGHHFDSPGGVAVSPDGRNAYVVSNGSDALLIFDRDPSTGQIALKPLALSCVAETLVALQCGDGVALDGAEGVAVSPDGRNVYVASVASNGVAVFDRNEGTGTTVQKAGTDGCVSTTIAGTCSFGKSMLGSSGIAISPDGRSAYVAAPGSSAVGVFDRDPGTGVLTQRGGTNGCVAEVGGVCNDGNSLEAVTDVAVSPDGRHLYAASVTSDAVDVFDRDPGNGNLTQKVGVAGCITETGTGGLCTDGRGLEGARDVAVSRDGRNVYAASSGGAVAVFDRDLPTGVLTQKAGVAGCISDDGSGGDCADGHALGAASAVAVSRDGASVYVASTDALAVFDRDLATGALSQKAGTAGCVSDSGSAGACADGRALVGGGDVTVSDDGRSVYALAATSDGVAAFDRSAVAYDIDGDGEVDPLTDGLLLLRYTFGFRGATLVTSAVDLVNCTRCTAADIEAFSATLFE